jgi:hypothetical protein
MKAPFAKAIVVAGLSRPFLAALRGALRQRQES